MIRQFFRDSALYTLASLFTKGIVFVMLPIYLSFLSKSEYGVLDYITTVGLVIGVVVALEISQAVIRFSSVADGSLLVKQGYISTGVYFMLSCYGVLILLSLMNLEGVALYLTGDENNERIALLAVVSYFSYALMYMTTVIYRSNFDVKAATLSSAFSAAMTAAVTLTLLMWFDMKLEGILIGVVLGQLTIAMINLYNLRRYWCVIPRFSVLIEMLKFSSPLVISSLGVVFATFADRLMIKDLLSFSELGEYGVAARLAAGVTLLTIGFQSALSPLIYSRIDDPNTSKDLKKLFSYYIGFSLVSVFLIGLLSEQIIELIAGEQYHDAPTVLTVLVLAVLLSNGYLFFPGLSVVRKTHILAMINLASGILNLMLNLFFIPRYGVFGAAFSTAFSALVNFLLNIYYSEMYYPVLKQGDRTCI